MADGMTTIRIGGSLPRALYDSLTGGQVVTEYTDQAGVWAIERLNGIESLVYSGEGADRFSFEDDLRRAGVPFDRYNESELDEELNPYEMLAYRPGVGEVSGGFDGQGHGDLTVAEVVEIIGDPELDPAAMVGKLRQLDSVKMHRFLRAYPLPALEISQAGEFSA